MIFYVSVNSDTRPTSVVRGPCAPRPPVGVARGGGLARPRPCLCPSLTHRLSQHFEVERALPTLVTQEPIIDLLLGEGCVQVRNTDDGSDTNP